MTMCLPLFTGALAASVPSAPESLTAVAGDGQIALVWFAPENDGGAAITSYQVSIDGGATWTDIGLATSHAYSGLTGGILYTFMVRAVNSAGNGEDAIATAKPTGSGAEATSTPTPAPIDRLGSLFDSWFEATPTPADGGTNAGSGGGHGIGPGGGGQKPGDGPQDPPQPPSGEQPPKVETPQPEDNIPIEINPEDVTEKSFKPKKEKVQEAVTVWTITADGTHTAGSKQPVPDAPCRFDFTLEFKAAHTGETIYGDYTGTGSLSSVMDQAFYATGMPGFSGEWDHAGPLTNIQFTLEKVKGEPDEKYKTAMEEYQKALDKRHEYNRNWMQTYRTAQQQYFREYSSGEQTPERLRLANEKITAEMRAFEEINPEPPRPKKPQNKNAYYAKGKGTMLWNPETVKNLFIDFKGEVIPEVGNERHWPSAFTWEIEVIIYANGNGVVKIPHGADLLTYKARLAKSVEMIDAD